MSPDELEAILREIDRRMADKLDKSPSAMPALDAR